MTTAGRRGWCWGGWIGVLVTTVLGIALDGVYAAGLPSAKVFDPTVFGDVLDTRYGTVALVRLALLACAFPLIRMLFEPATGGGARRCRRGGSWPRALVGVGLVGHRPALAGHAGTGIQTGLAIPADAIHVLAMACWLGGLVVLLVAVLPRRDADELRAVLPRYSTARARRAIVALIVTGGYQAWRQVGQSRRAARHRLRPAARRQAGGVRGA